MNILETVNKEVNRKIRYKPDSKDYWQTPEETLSLGTGDCEDYAILKYFMLIERAYEEEYLRLSYCYLDDGIYSVPHMTLLVHNESDWAVLDNNYNSIYKLSEMPIKELFRFNREHLWIVRYTDNEPNGVEIITEESPTARLGLWKNVCDNVMS